MAYEVVTTSEADAEIAEAESWWFAHRPKAPLLFFEELEDAFDRLAETPLIGRKTPQEGYPDLRSLLLRKTRHHLVFVCSEADRRVLILGLWNAVRGREPKLPLPRK